MQKHNTEKEAVQILHELEDLWRKFDKIYESLNSSKWEKPFGSDWKFSDQPFHLAYFDRMVTHAIANGKKASSRDLQNHFKTPPQINKWNESEFKKRPKRYSPQKSLEDFKVSHEELRKIVRKKIKHMDEGSWMPLFFGWVTAIDVLTASLVHSVGEYIELCLRVKHPVDVLPVSCRRRERFILQFMSMSVHKKEAMNKNFVLAWHFTGRGSSSWVIRVENGIGKLTEGSVKNPDLSMSMSLVSFEKMLRHMKNPMLMMLTGEIKVGGFMKLPVFMKLFPQS